MPTRGFANQTGQGGEYRKITPKWPASTAVAPGDLVWWDTSDDTHKPMSSYVWNTNIATTAGTANAVFAGVSCARRLATQTTAGGVADGMIVYTGEFCFDCDALGAAVDPGALVSFAANAGADGLENQKVRTTATAGEAIGRVTRPAAAGQTSLYFTLLTPLIFGGPTAAA